MGSLLIKISIILIYFKKEHILVHNVTIQMQDTMQQMNEEYSINIHKDTIRHALKSSCSHHLFTLDGSGAVLAAYLLGAPLSLSLANMDSASAHPGPKTCR